MKINAGEVCHTVLVVEDDVAIREAVKMALEFEDYTIFTASNGQEALLALRRVNS